MPFDLTLREIVALSSAIVAAASLALGFWNARKAQAINIALQLSADMREKWSGGWAAELDRFERYDSPLSASDVKTLREMLNWVSWIGAFYKAGLLPSAGVILGRGSLGPAMRRIMTVGRPVIQGDVARNGVEYWEDLAPLCKRLYADDVAKLLSKDHEALRLARAAYLKAPDAAGTTIERLKPTWPEPEEQLHTGGWRTTDWLVYRLAITHEARVLDLCCGEGATAVWIARLTGAEVRGADFDLDGIDFARRSARAAGQHERCRFDQCDIVALPYDDGYFSVVMGQDPDGLATPDVAAKFAELFRVLEPGGVLGFHHWVAAPGAPHETRERYHELNERLECPEYGETTADTYLAALEAAGFENVEVQPLFELYNDHMQAVVDRTRSAIGPTDAWSEGWLELAETHPFGVAIFANKPS